MDDDYYYYDEYADYGGGDYEETSETPLETKYLEAKGFFHSCPETCVRLLGEVMREDVENGRWTFKCLKRLTRAARLAKDYPTMMQHFKSVARFAHSDIGRSDIQKAMTKFLTQSQYIPDEYVHEAIKVVLDIAGRDKDAYANLWLSTVIRHCDLLIDEGRFSETLRDLEGALAWCKTSTAASQLNNSATQLYTIYFLQIKAYWMTCQYSKSRQAYFAAMRVPTTLIPLRTVGGVMEWGGYLFLELGDWQAANKAFTASFCCYDDSADPQRSVVLKYAAVTAMLGGSSVNCFAAGEAKALAVSPVVQPVFQLFMAFLKHDLTTCLRVLDDPQHRGTFHDDIHMFPLIKQLLFQLRLNMLIKFVACFTSVKVATIGSHLQLGDTDVVNICSFAILHKLITGSINEGLGIIRVCTTAPASVQQRTEALAAWSESFCTAC